MFSITKAKKGKVYVGLSGGVDSSVSAALLKRAGYDVTAVFIRIAIEGYPCPAAQDRIEAMRAAAHLKIPFIEIDLSKEYQKLVFDYSVGEFARGRTPNPDALCNREIKFGLFYDFARESGADFVATGHYARITTESLPLVRSGPLGQVQHSPSGIQLLAGVDDTKDQSYFLWAVPQGHLQHVLFPVGGMKKTQVRALAKKFKLPNSKRPDSQGLCFLGDISIEDMLARETRPEPGNVLSESGEVIGSHRGASLYTLGQRHGFEVAAHASEAPALYVVGKDIEKNTITVSASKFPPHAKRTALLLEQENWIGALKEGDYDARFRYRQKLIPAKVKIIEGNAVVVLSEPHYVPLGQSLVLYRGERCMGGGIIRSASLAA